MNLIIIAAVSENGVIGRDGDLPWHLPRDLKRFKQLTSGHTIIMGRKTFDSCDRKPLPNRRNIVVTRDPSFEGDGIEVAHSMDEALSLAAKDDTVFIVGGSAIYEMSLPLADAMELTRVHTSATGDVRFPDFKEANWDLVNREYHEADETHQFAFSFLTYQRPPPNP